MATWSHIQDYVLLHYGVILIYINTFRITWTASGIFCACNSSHVKVLGFYDLYSVTYWGHMEYSWILESMKKYFWYRVAWRWITEHRPCGAGTGTFRASLINAMALYNFCRCVSIDCFGLRMICVDNTDRCHPRGWYHQPVLYLSSDSASTYSPYPP